MFLSNRGSFRPETSGAYTLRRRGRRRPKSGSAIGACAVARLAGSGGPIGDYYGSANKATAAQARAVASLLEREAEVRERNKRERLYRRARFPQPKSFADYDFSRVSMPEGYAPEDLMSLAFLDAAEGFVLHGPTGRGKTHMAIAMGTAAVQAGRAARFFTAADMVLWLKRMRREDRLEAAMRELAKCELLIVDEFGYVPLDVEGARLLFQVVADCYERRSLVITTNIEFSKWGTVLADDKLASAMIDRIVHHGRLIEFTGPSRRMDAALMLAGAREAV